MITTAIKKYLAHSWSWKKLRLFLRGKKVTTTEERRDSRGIKVEIFFILIITILTHFIWGLAVNVRHGSKCLNARSPAGLGGDVLGGCSIFRGQNLLEEVCHWRWTLRFNNLALLPICSRRPWLWCNVMSCVKLLTSWWVRYRTKPGTKINSSFLELLPSHVLLQQEVTNVCATALKYCFYMYHLWATNTRSLMLFFKLYRLHQNKMFKKEKQLAKSIGRMFLLRTVLLLRTQFSFIQTEVCSFWDLYSTLVMEQISFPECRTHFNFTTSFF